MKQKEAKPQIKKPVIMTKTMRARQLKAHSTPRKKHKKKLIND